MLLGITHDATAVKLFLVSLIRTPLQFLRDLSPFLLTALAVLAVIVFLFAYPLISAGLALAVPLLTVGVVGGLVLWMNARMSMWHGRRPFFFGVADWGFLGCFAAFAAYGFANFESSGQMIAYVFVGVVFVAAARFAFMEFEAWALGIVFTIIMLLITGQYLLFTLTHPEWFFDFLPSLLVVASLALIVMGSVASYLGANRIEATDEAPPSGSLAMRGLAAGLLVLVALSAVATFAARTDATTGEGIALEWGSMSQTEQIKAGVNRLLLRNDDLTVHTFTWLREEQVNCFVNHVGQESCETATYATGYDFAVGPGSERVVTVSLQKGVSYRLVCAVPGHNEEDGFYFEN